MKSSVRKSSCLIQNPCEMIAQGCVISSSTHTHAPTSGARQMCECSAHSTERVYTQPCEHIQSGGISTENIVFMAVIYLCVESLPFYSSFGLFFLQSTLRVSAMLQWNFWATNSRPGCPSSPTSKFPTSAAFRGSEKLPIHWENVHNSSANCYS